MALINQILLGFAVVAVLSVGVTNADQHDWVGPPLVSGSTNLNCGYMVFTTALLIPLLHVMLRKMNLV